MFVVAPLRCCGSAAVVLLDAAVVVAEFAECCRSVCCRAQDVVESAASAVKRSVSDCSTMRCHCNAFRSAGFH